MARKELAVTDNVISIDFTPRKEPLDPIDDAVQRLEELEVRTEAAVREERQWRSWERRKLFLRIRQLRDDLRAERRNQFDDEAVFRAAVVLAAESPGVPLAAKAIAAHLMPFPTHSAAVRVGQALGRLEKTERVERVPPTRSTASRWKLLGNDDG